MWAVRMVQAVPGMALLAHGVTRPFLGAGLIRASGLLGAFCAVGMGGGVEGVAAAGLAAELASLAYMCWQLERVQAGRGRECVASTWLLVPAIASSIALAGITSGLLGNAVIFLAVACSVLPVGMLALPEIRRALVDAWRQRGLSPHASAIQS